MKELPKFRARRREEVREYAEAVFSNKAQPDDNYLLHITEYPDGHYRALFDGAYFVLAEGRDEPSKSQWNSLKKKLKRHDPGVFVFKEHGAAQHPEAERCYYVEFGFFAIARPH